MTKNDELLEQLKIDYTQADLSDADRTMLDYVSKLTLAPATVTEGDIHALQQAGFDDRAILDIAHITGYFALVTRLADGLGVALEPGVGDSSQKG